MTKDLEKAQLIYDGAKRALGPDLCGYSLIDLLADNMELPLSTLRELAKELISREKGNYYTKCEDCFNILEKGATICPYCTKRG